MFNQRKKKIIPQVSKGFTGGQTATSRAKRLCELAKEARAILKPWAKLPAEELDLFKKNYDKDLGQHEGTGMLLRMGRLDPKGTGSITPEEEEEFLRNMMTLADECLGFLSNCMIISTLALGIAIPLSLHEITNLDLESPALGGSGDGTVAIYENWFRPNAMHVVHILELLCLSYSIYRASNGILNALCLYSVLSIYLPDAESKLRFLVLRRDRLLVAFTLAVHSLEGLFCALPLCAAKFSPPASIVLAIPIIGFNHFFTTNILVKIANPAMLYQHKLARELYTAEELVEEDDIGDGVSVSPIKE